MMKVKVMKSTSLIAGDIIPINSIGEVIYKKGAFINSSVHFVARLGGRHYLFVFADKSASFYSTSDAKDLTVQLLSAGTKIEIEL